MKDNITLEVVWRDTGFFQATVFCASENVSVKNNIYITDDGLDDLVNGIQLFLSEKKPEFFWESCDRGDKSSASVSFCFMRKDGRGHILIEVYLELDDGGKHSRHNCCFFVNTELGLLEQFREKLIALKQLPLGAKVSLNP